MKAIAFVGIVTVVIFVGAVRKTQKTRKAEDKDALRVQYFEAGVQYYVSARFAAIAGFLPVYGLKRIWRCYKKDVSDSALDKFDALISSLDKFERIRYPERGVERGMVATINFKKSDPAVSQGTPNHPEPAYEIVVGELSLEPRRVLRDEGFRGGLRIAFNMATNPALRQRILAMRRLFRKYGEHLGAISLVGQREPSNA